MICTTEAVVLQSRKQGDTSKIVTLYTREFGKLNVIAKGARDSKSKFGGALEAFALTTVVFYKKEARDLYLLSKAELLRSRSSLLNSIEQIEIASRIVELIRNAMHDEEENAEIFELLNLVLDALAEIGSDPSAREGVVGILFAFYLRFATVGGFGIQYVPAPGDQAADSRYTNQLHFDMQNGELMESAVLREDFRENGSSGLSVAKGFPVRPEVHQALKFLMASDLKSSARLRISPQSAAELSELFRGYFAEHASGITRKSFRTDRVFASLSRKS